MKGGSKDGNPLGGGRGNLSTDNGPSDRSGHGFPDGNTP